MAFNPLGNRKDFQKMAKIATQEFWRYYQELVRSVDDSFTPDMNDIRTSLQGQSAMVCGKLPASVAAKSPALLDAGFVVGQRIVFDRLVRQFPALLEYARNMKDLDFEAFMAEVGRLGVEIRPETMSGEVVYTAWLSAEPDEFGNIKVRNGFGIDSPCILASETDAFLPFSEWSGRWLAEKITDALHGERN